LSQRIVDVYENFDSNFAKSACGFFETKFYRIYQRITEHKISVNEVILIPPKPLQIYCEKHGKMIEIPVPCAHIGEKPISCRLFSARRREGMVS
jgi:Hormone-sensitive lipase (HSL) N-terminus